MARPSNPETSVIRHLVSGWLSRTTLQTFSVPTLAHELRGLLTIYRHLDLSKCLGNELMRRERAGLLESEMGEPHGPGRPPRVYRQRWK